MSGIQQLANLFLAIEGPYKWYVLASIAVGITVVVTFFIFRTLKWVLLIAALGFILFYLWSRIFVQFNATWWSNSEEKSQQIQQGAAVVNDSKKPSPN